MRGILLPWGCFLGVSFVIAFAGGRYCKAVTCQRTVPRQGLPGVSFRVPRRKSKGALLIWLILSQHTAGVQVWQQGTLQGQPVFNTDGVAQTNDAYDLSPVQHPNTPVVDPSALTRPACLRDICVYRPDEMPLPQVLVADVRLFGPLLGTWICRAFGLQDSEWSCRRLAEALPSFPSEQYVLTPRHHPRYRSYIPVDLRPLGGPVVLCDAIRAQPCGHIALHALAGRAASLTGGLVCRCSQGRFLPSAYLSLLPYGDAFQVWPAQHINVATQPIAQDSLPRPPTLEDRFASSLDRTSAAEVAFHEVSGSNAVIIGDNGLVYAEVPTFADHRVIRTAALQAYALHDPNALGALHFARIMPPLAGLPTIQFAAVHCAGTDEPSIGKDFTDGDSQPVKASGSCP